MKKTEGNRPIRRSRCDIREEDDRIIMRLEMPGVQKNGLDIHVEGDKLIIEGRRTQDTIKGTWLVREIHGGDYRMEYSIDETINRDSIEAVLEKGVLMLTLGLSEAVKPKRIEVVSKS